METSNIEHPATNIQSSEGMSERELAENFDKLSPEQFERLLDIWQAKLFADQLSGKWKYDLLKENRPGLFQKTKQPKTNEGNISTEGATEVAGVPPPVPGDDWPENRTIIPSRVGNMAALAGFLNQYFRGKICKTIQPNHVSQWCRANGEFLGWVMIDGAKVVPPALCCEAPNTKFYDPKVALEWFEKWMLPQAKWRVKENEIELTHEEKMQRFAERKAQREEDIAEGRFKSVEIFNQQLAVLGICINRALNSAEPQLKKTILEEIKNEKLKMQNGSDGANGTDDEVIEQAIAAGVRAGIDQVRERVAEALVKAKVAEGLTAESAKDAKTGTF